MSEISDIQSVSAVPSRISPVPVYVEWIERTSRQLTFLLQCVLFLGLVSLVVFAIAELAARDSMLTLVSSRGAALKSEFVERTRANETTGGIATPDSDMARRTALKQIEYVEDLKRSIQSLAALGAETSGQSLRATQRGFAELNRSIELGTAPSKGSTASPLSALADTFVAPLLLYGSDLLLAIVVLGCGAIGAMISSLRSGEALSLRSFILGLASGFVAYLVIKGGKHVFLMQVQGEIVAFNPYGTAFAGLLAGLFTERAHQLLTFLVDDLANRIRAASETASNRAPPAAGIEHEKRDA